MARGKTNGVVVARLCARVQNQIKASCMRATCTRCSASSRSYGQTGAGRRTDATRRWGVECGQVRGVAMAGASAVGVRIDGWTTG